jgi:PAS domain-containing protein
LLCSCISKFWTFYKQRKKSWNQQKNIEVCLSKLQIIWVFDLNCDIVDCNPKCLSFTGFSKEQFVERSFVDLAVFVKENLLCVIVVPSVKGPWSSLD